MKAVMTGSGSVERVGVMANLPTRRNGRAAADDAPAAGAVSTRQGVVPSTCPFGSNTSAVRIRVFIHHARRFSGNNRGTT